MKQERLAGAWAEGGGGDDKETPLTALGSWVGTLLVTYLEALKEEVTLCVWSTASPGSVSSRRGQGLTGQGLTGELTGVESLPCMLGWHLHLSCAARSSPITPSWLCVHHLPHTSFHTFGGHAPTFHPGQSCLRLLLWAPWLPILVLCISQTF